MASQQDEIIFYDIPSRGHCTCWSPNLWKTRLLLNAKNLPYKTEWLAYPDIASTLKSHGLPPHADGMHEGTLYTVPTICLPDGPVVMDSLKLAAEVEKYYPSPPLHVNAPEVKEVSELMGKFMYTMAGLLLPKVPRDILRPACAEYFERTRAVWFGKPLAELQREAEADEENLWERAEPGLKRLGEMLGPDGGPFLSGEEVSYADLIIAAYLQFLIRVKEGYFDRVVKVEPRLGKLYDACEQWFKRDDY